MIGLESCFGVVNKILVDEGKMKLKDIIPLLTIKPREIMGFDSDLFIEGKKAEIVVLDPDKEWIFEKEHVQSKSINSPFYGKKMKGSIIMTISRGKVALNKT